MKSFSIPLNFSHKCRLLRSPDINIPREIEIPILLIRNELQSRMLFNHFKMIGFEECHLETSLDHLILASLRMWDGTDETFNLYSGLMEKWSENINADDNVIIRRALKIYHALIKERDKKGPSKIRGNHQSR